MLIGTVCLCLENTSHYELSFRPHKGRQGVPALSGKAPDENRELAEDSIKSTRMQINSDRLH